MSTAVRRQQRYDHRLRELVRRTGELRLATKRGVPRSTARGWLGTSPSAVTGLHGSDLTEADLRHEMLKRQERVQNLAALLRRVLAVRAPCARSCAGERLPDGAAKARILRAVDRARTCIPCEGSCGSCICHQARVTRDAAGSAHVRSTISGRVPARRRTA